MHSDENILYFNEDSSNAVFNNNEKGILNIDLNCIDLDDNNFDEADLDTIIHARLLDWRIKFKKSKALKKELNEELMPITCHLNDGIGACQTLRRKKQIQCLLQSYKGVGW